eukprot:3933334-Rhodomonas_salina.4
MLLPRTMRYPSTDAGCTTALRTHYTKSGTDVGCAATRCVEPGAYSAVQQDAVLRGGVWYGGEYQRVESIEAKYHAQPAYRDYLLQSYAGVAQVPALGSR